MTISYLSIQLPNATLLLMQSGIDVRETNVLSISFSSDTVLVIYPPSISNLPLSVIIV